MINDAAEDLLLAIFSHFTLKSLIAAQGVSKRWRKLVPLADVLPARRTLLEFYLDLLSSKVFVETRPWTIANLRPFDRQRYVEDLLKQYDYLPEAYRLWILEWPARAVIGCCWPGLPSKECTYDMADGVNRREGWNWQGFVPPQVSTLRWNHWISPNSRSSRVLVEECLPGILVWTSPQIHTWLSLDQRECKRDKVYELAGDEDVLRGDDGDDFDEAYLDWVQWLRKLWKSIESAADPTIRPTKIPYSIIHKPRAAIRIPATPWGMRDRAPWKKRDRAPPILRDPIPQNPRERTFWHLRRRAEALTSMKPQHRM